MTKTPYGNDHDLIIEIRTVQSTMLGEIREIKDGTAKRIADLEQTKLDTKDSYPALYKKGVDEGLKNHETRINTLETMNTRQTVMLSIGIAMLTLLVSIMTYHVLGK